MSKRILEVCVDSIESGLNASMGAERIELCAALSEGGLTPSLGLFVQLKKKIPPNTTQIFVMLRPRRGTDFCYSEDEMESLLIDLEEFKARGADGFVFGALTEDGQIDVVNCSRVVQAAAPLTVTFHRAFDVAQGDPEAHLQTIIELGFKRLLSSGQQCHAEAGLENIAKWNQVYGHSITIMPGAGINPGNLTTIMEKSGCREFHSSCKETLKVPLNVIIGDSERNTLTDLETVKTLVAILQQ